ncbi:succinate dehydrogenase, cytochrome b556 subunit [Candidatus Pelagibacter bacterium]|nr:succinate dehydrogenase, cytochrome b556 subunit [Candidatus Pelagibacter bacterium]
MDNNNPLSPHIQVYRWHISSLVSISHRITGIVNISAITVICFWIFSLLLGETSYDFTKLFLQSIFGKFIIICLTWSFCFQTLSEIRHLAMDLGYGFELKISNITGSLVIFGSIFFTILFYLLGRNFI